MALSTEQKERLAGLARDLIAGMGVVDIAVKEALDERRGVSDGSAAVGSATNAMAHGRVSEVRSVGAIVNSQTVELRNLRDEPFIVRVVAEDGQGQVRNFFFARSMPLRTSSLNALNGSLASYRGPLGRLAEREPGDELTVKNITYTVLERVRLKPTRVSDGWDGLHDRIEADGLAVTLNSLSQYLAQFGPPLEVPDLLAELEAAAEAADAVHAGLRRRVIDRISLRDEAILDQYQGEVFRLPLNRRLMLSGPPGTGKTTTLIKRIAQKSRAEEITDEERELTRDPEIFFRPGNWIMYTPTQLLKLYLKEAFAREFVAASDERVRTWTDERRRMARDVLSILRSATRGKFTLDEEAMILSDTTSTGQMRLADAFATAFASQTSERYASTFAALTHTDDPKLKSLLAKIRRRVGEKIAFSSLFDLVDFHDELTAHDKEVTAKHEQETRDEIGTMVRMNPRLIDELAKILAAVSTTDSDEDEDADDEPSRPIKAGATGAALNALRRAITDLAKELHDGRSRTKTGRNRTVLDWLGARIPKDEVLRRMGAPLVTSEHLTFLNRTYRNLIEQVPVEYRRFRREALKSNLWFRPEARSAITRGVVTGDEVDVMLLVMFRHANQFLKRNGGRLLNAGNTTGIAVLDSVKGELVTQVLVDEATDFSPVQLACMQELARPEFRSFFVCGDIRQRVTPWGIRSVDELKWVDPEFEVKEITIGYRQSRRLSALADALAQLNGDEQTLLKSPSHVEDADIPPLLAEHLQGENLALWLRDRIRDVERALGSLPSIAVFVDGDALVEPLVRSLRPHLAGHNLEVIGCREGRVVGSDYQIRVFDVQHIKGLEFEAVFFVGIDSFARRIPDLFGKFLYVGSTRAATYLGLTCDAALPMQLEPVRGHFSSENW